MGERPLGEVAHLPAEARNMLLERLTKQPGDPGHRGKGDRQTIFAELLAHHMRCIVDLLTDTIFPAVEKRSGLQGVAGNLQLTPQFGALDHRAACGVDETSARGPHHSSPRASRSSRNAA